MHLIFCNGMLNQLQNWILRELIPSYGSQWSPLKLIYLVGTVCEGWISYRFTFVQKGVLIITQGYIQVSEQGF